MLSLKSFKILQLLDIFLHYGEFNYNVQITVYTTETRLFLLLSDFGTGKIPGLIET